MKNLSKSMLGFVLLILISSVYAADNSSAPLTTAEKTNYTKTSTYKEVMQFITDLQKITPYVKVQSLCTSAEGRDIPLVILGKPVPSSPLELRYDGRMVVYIEANIHAGEVEGKEAVLALARDITTGQKLSLLDDLVILIAPIFNADGNEKFSDKNRTSQNGPKEVGIRYNGQGLDLNRDAMKLETPEVTALVTKVLNKWDPALLIDCHTTNGSYHIEPVTYVWGFNPNGDRSIIDYMRKKMMPQVSTMMEKKYDILSVVYGNFMDYKNPEKGWVPAGPQVRYITNYTGLRNRLAILDENYTHADFKTRIKGAYALLASSLTFCQNHKNEILHLISDADKKTIRRGLNPSPADSFIVKYNMEALDEKITLRGYEYEIVKRKNAYPRIKKLDKERIYHMPYFCNFTSKKSVKLPFGYLIPVHSKIIEKKLLQHGLIVEKLTEPVTVKVETFKIKELIAPKRPYQGHYINRLKGEYSVIEKEFPKGTIFVPTGQKLGNLAAYLLEPESDDGFVAWNFFDRYLVTQWGSRYRTLPVYRMLEPKNMAKKQICLKNKGN